MKRTKQTNLRIIAACSVAIFSLAALFSGVYAWFVLKMDTALASDEFVVVNIGQCDLYSVKLIKFDYASQTVGTGEYEFTNIDYLSPEDGEVNIYGYNKDEHSFGYEDSSEWVKVEAMNVYDPIESIIMGSTLKDLNCNAIYEFTITSTDLTSVYLNATVSKNGDATKEEEEIFLTSCADFDIYTLSDLSDSNPLFIDGEDTKLYYPNYIDKEETLSSNEDIYYKLSYLSSLESSHPHLYGTTDTDAVLSANKAVNFVYDSTLEKNVLTFYVNVNYAPEELEYTTNLIYLGNIKAISDFSFKFGFEAREDE